MIYLASPYSHPEVRRAHFATVAYVAARLMGEGHLIFSPICHTHPICIAGGLPPGYDFWERYDREILAICSEVWVVMMDGWRESRGIAAELKLAQELGIPYKYI